MSSERMEAIERINALSAWEGEGGACAPSPDSAERAVIRQPPRRKRRPRKWASGFAVLRERKDAPL